MPGAPAALGEAAQPGGRVVAARSARGSLGVGLGVEQQVAVLGRRTGRQPVDEAKELAVVVLACRARRCAGPSRSAALAGWARKPAPSASIASSTPSRRRSSARVPGSAATLRPPLEPAAVGRALVGPRTAASWCAGEPEQREVGVDLAGEHRLEVELDVGLAGERRVVAQDAQRPAVARRSPTEPLRARLRSSWTRPCGPGRRRRRRPWCGGRARRRQPTRWIGTRRRQAWEIG